MVSITRQRKTKHARQACHAACLSSYVTAWIARITGMAQIRREFVTNSAQYASQCFPVLLRPSKALPSLRRRQTRPNHCPRRRDIGMGCQERQGRQERQNDAAFCQKYSVHFFGFWMLVPFTSFYLQLGRFSAISLFLSPFFKASPMAAHERNKEWGKQQRIGGAWSGHVVKFYTLTSLSSLDFSHLVTSTWCFGKKVLNCQNLVARIELYRREAWDSKYYTIDSLFFALAAESFASRTGL